MSGNRHFSASDIPHEWLFPASFENAATVQRQLAERVIREDAFTTITNVAGADISNMPRDPENLIYAALVPLSFPALLTLGTSCVRTVTNFPYVPGFLGFREAPALVETYHQLCNRNLKPDLIMVDGHGISHPRGLGIASHLGVLLDCPTIGVAKSILVGAPAREPGNQTGDWAPLEWKGKTIGAVLRTRPNVKPLYISSGHRIELDTAIDLVKRCLKGYRLPETTRQAHNAANAYRKELTRPSEDNPQLKLI